MPTIAAGASSTVALTGTQTITISCDLTEKALVSVTRGSQVLFAGQIGGVSTIGPFALNDVFSITANRGDVDYTLTAYSVPPSGGSVDAASIATALTATDAAGRAAVRNAGYISTHIGAVADQAQMLAIVGARIGDTVRRLDTSTDWRCDALPSSVIESWRNLGAAGTPYTDAQARAAVLLAPATVNATATLTRSANGNRTNFVTANGLSLTLATDTTDSANPWQPDDMIVVQGFSSAAATVAAGGGVTFLTDAGTTAATASAVGRQVVLQHTNAANEWRVLSAAVVTGGGGGNPQVYAATNYATKNGTAQATIATIAIPAGVVGKRGRVRLRANVLVPGATDAWELAAYASGTTFDSTTLIAVDTIGANILEYFADWLVAAGNGADLATIRRPAHSQGAYPGNPAGVSLSFASGGITETITTVPVDTAAPWTITLRAKSTGGATDTLTPLSVFAEVFTAGD